MKEMKIIFISILRPQCQGRTFASWFSRERAAKVEANLSQTKLLPVESLDNENENKLTKTKTKTKTKTGLPARKGGGQFFFTRV